MHRDNTKVIKIGNKVIGGGNPILIQSMTNTKTEDVEATVAQIKELEKEGCDIIRVAVPTMEAAEAIAKINKAKNAEMSFGTDSNSEWGDAKLDSADDDEEVW